MDDLSFIESLEISTDDRLRRTRMESDGSAPGPLKGEPTSPADVRSVALGDGVQAAVNAGSVISFVSGLSSDEKADVMFSTQFAQRAASSRFGRSGETEDWYGVYVEVLERLGWVGEGFAFTNRGSKAGEFSMDKSALDVIATIATGNQLAILVKALDTLKGLADDSGALTVFELQAIAELSGNFQLGAVQKAENGALSLALGAFHFKTNDAHRKVLFWRWGSETIDFWTAAQKMSFNAEHYSKLRGTVEEKLASDAGDYIVAFELS